MKILRSLYVFVVSAGGVKTEPAFWHFFEPCLMLRYMIFYFTYMSCGGVGRG